MNGYGVMRREKEITEEEKITHILKNSKVLHLGLSDGELPYVVPMNYGYVYENGKLTLYLHGGLRGYKYDLIEKNPNCSFSMECDLIPFLGKVPCQSGIGYMTIGGRGKALMVDSKDEKDKALSLIMELNGWENCSFNEKLTSVVNIFKIEVSEFIAKERPVPKVHR